MANHALPKEYRSRLSMLGRRNRHDDLFERSFRSCDACGEDVYVLAIDCRSCGAEVELRAS